MRRFKKPTIKDVARQAGVSTTTVSLFVSGREDVCSPPTAERIREAIAALNYTPSSLVGSVQSRLKYTLGVCMYNPLNSGVRYGNLFFERLRRGILAQADENDYSILSYSASVRDSQRCEPFLDGRVDGVLFHAHSFENARPARVASAGMPVVLIDRSQHIPEGCGAAYSDDAEVADLAMSHLWDLGHRRIAHLAGPVEYGPAMHPDTNWEDDVALRRLQAYRTWMESRSIGDPELIGYCGDWVPKHIPVILDRWMTLPQPPTAVFCANDALALALMTEALQRGLRVPEDLSLVGVDNSTEAYDAVVPLTTIEVPVEAIGREAVRVLLNLLHGAPLEECQSVVAGSMIVLQESTGPVAAAGPSK